MSELPLFDRRTFLVSTGLAAGGALTLGVAPLPSSAAAPRAPLDAGSDSEGSGHVDDACGHCPPYSHSIPYGYALTAACTWSSLDPIDHIFMI